MRTERESRKRTLHGTYGGQAPFRRNIRIDECLQKTGRLVFQFGDTRHLRIDGCDAGVQRGVFGRDTHLFGRQARHAHLEVDELFARTLFDGLHYPAYLSYGAVVKVCNIKLFHGRPDYGRLYQGVLHDDIKVLDFPKIGTIYIRYKLFGRTLFQFSA